MSGVIPVLLRVHLACAFGAIALFWLTAFADKGGRVHRRAGRWFARLIYAAALTGGVMALIQLAADVTQQVMWLVLYLLVVIVAPVQHGLATIAAASLPMRTRSLPHAVLNVLAILGGVALIPAAVAWQQWTFFIVAPAGFITGLRNLAYGGRRAAAPIDWEREHLTSMITAGIWVHTTLLVFATSRTLGWNLTGWRALVPWLLPAVVGLPLIVWLRHVRRTT